MRWSRCKEQKGWKIHIVENGSFRVPQQASGLILGKDTARRLQCYSLPVSRRGVEEGCFACRSGLD
jgi:hypothetical protein